MMRPLYGLSNGEARRVERFDFFAAIKKRELGRLPDVAAPDVLRLAAEDEAARRRFRDLGRHIDPPAGLLFYLQEVQHDLRRYSQGESVDWIDELTDKAASS